MGQVNNIHLQDAHLHLADQPQTITSSANISNLAKSSNIKRLFTNTACESEWSSSIELAGKNKSISSYIGIHPWYADNLSSGWLQRLENKLLESNSGVGEIGLDKKCKTPKEIQEKVFQKQFELACKLNRPITIHCLERWGFLADYLTEQKSLPPIILHSFNSSAEMAQRFIKLGCHLSFSLPLLKRKTIAKYLENLPINHILLESDMNYQVKVTGKLEEWPNDLITSYQLLAEIKNLTVTELAQELWNNGKIFKT